MSVTMCDIVLLIEFISTSQFRYLPGPVHLSKEEQPKLKELIDTVLNFNIIGNKISYNSLKNNKLIKKEIVQLTLDSLYLLDSKKNLHKYLRIYQDSINNNNVNRIVLSSAGCYGLCPIIDIEINESKFTFMGNLTLNLWDCGGYFNWFLVINELL